MPKDTQAGRDAALARELAAKDWGPYTYALPSLLRHIRALEAERDGLRAEMRRLADAALRGVAAMPEDGAAQYVLWLTDADLARLRGEESN